MSSVARAPLAITLVLATDELPFNEGCTAMTRLRFVRHRASEHYNSKDTQSQKADDPVKTQSKTWLSVERLHGGLLSGPGWSGSFGSRFHQSNAFSKRVFTEFYGRVI